MVQSMRVAILMVINYVGEFVNDDPLLPRPVSIQSDVATISTTTSCLRFNAKPYASVPIWAALVYNNTLYINTPTVRSKPFWFHLV